MDVPTSPLTASVPPLQFRFLQKVRIHPHVKTNLNCSFHPLENNVNSVQVLL